MKDKILIDTFARIERFKKTGDKSLPQLLIKTFAAARVARKHHGLRWKL